VVEVIVVPPELSLQPALLLGRPERARAVARLRAGVIAAGGATPRLFVEDGGRTAPQCARALAASGTAAVVLVGDGADGAVTSVLRDELARHGIAAVLGDARSALPAGAAEGEWDAGDEALALHAFAVDPAIDIAAAERDLRERITAHGAARIRLRLPPPVKPVAPTMFLSAHLLALREPPLRARLLMLAAFLRPACVPLLQLAAQWCDLGLDPLLQCYAGNGVADRNRELIANIVP